MKTQANLDQVLPLTELAGFIASELSVDKLLGVNLHKLENADVQMLIDKFPGQRVNLNNALDNCRWIKSVNCFVHLFMNSLKYLFFRKPSWII